MFMSKHFPAYTLFFWGIFCFDQNETLTHPPHPHVTGKPQVPASQRVVFTFLQT